MSEFDRVMEFVLREEGGLVDNPKDPGGLTNFGISQRAHPTVDIRALTRDKAKEIYRRDYWNPLVLDTRQFGPALVIMDCAVLQGVGKARSILAQAASSSMSFVIAFQAERLLHYASLPTWPTFGRGWTRRLLRLTVEASK